MRLFHLILVSFTILAQTRLAHAGFALPTHKLSGFGLLGGYGNGFTERIQTQGNNEHVYLRSDSQTFSGGGSMSGEGFSYIGHSYNTAISVESTSDNRKFEMYTGLSSNVTVTAIRDVLVTDGAIYGNSIRLTFDFFGNATREMPDYFLPGKGGTAGMRVYTQGFDVQNFFAFKDTDALLSNNFVFLGFDYTGYVEDGVSRGLVDHSEVNVYDNRLLGATGDFHVDAAYDEKLGGYGFAMAMFSMKNTMGGYTESNFYASLRDISYDSQASARSSNGSRNYIDLSTAQFDSGMSGTAPAAVPEPASLAMWGIGAIGAFAVRRRRQNKSPIA